jgi:protein TonB
VIALSPEDLADLRRWAISGAIVMLAYGGIAAAMVTWHEPIEPDEPAGAIVIDFAPVAVAPTAQETDLPPGPEQMQSPAVPDKPVEKVEEKPEEKIEAKGEEEVEEKVEPKPVEERPRAEVPVTTAPSAAPQTAALPAAPVQGKPNPIAMKAVQAWMGQLSSLLDRHKRYPAESLTRREHGTARVSFSLDRQGRVIESRIVQSSGAAALDEEALALLRRVQPFPVWPREVSAGDHLDLTVPIAFGLSDASGRKR